MSDKKGKNYIAGVLYVLYAFIGAYGAVMSFASCFKLEKEPVFYLVPVVVTVLVCTIFFVECISTKALIVILLGTGAFSWVRIKDIVGSFITVANIMIDDVNESYMIGFASFEYPEFVKEYRDTDLFLTLAIFVITVLICYFVMGHASVVGCIVMSLPITVFGIFFDIFPQRPYLVMSVMFWAVAATLKASGRHGRKQSDVAAFNALIIVVMIGVIAVIAQKVTPEAKYSRDDKLKEIKVFINEQIKGITSVASDTSESDKESSGVGDGSFGDRDKISFTGKKMLEVEVPLLNENIYLRAGEYNDYTGNGWSNNEVWFRNYFADLYEMKTDTKWPQNITNRIVKEMQGVCESYGISIKEYVEMTGIYTIKIDNQEEEAYSFAPYGAFLSGDLKQDFVLDKAKTNPLMYDVYTANLDEFISVFGGGLSDNYYDGIRYSDMIYDEFREILELEKSYASYVRKAYTQVPEGLSGTLKKYAPHTIEYDYWSTMEFVKEIQSMFRREFTYSLEPGRVPLGEDGIEYFLEENRKGYCVYFASAATMIFRQAGIPARYVEGYVITPDMASINKAVTRTEYRGTSDEVILQDVEYVTVTVPDNKAHAWTEIYIAGYGWIPIEVTPGYYTGTVSESDENDEKTEETAAKEEESESQTEKSNLDEKNRQGVQIDWKETGKMLLILCAVAMFMTGVIFGSRRWYAVGKKRLKRIIYGDDSITPKMRACLAWWYIESVMAYLGTPIPENISCEQQKEFLKENTEFFSKSDFNGTIDYIIKAYYGNENLTNEEIEKIGEMVGAFRENVYESLSGIKRFVFKNIRRL